MVLDVVVHPFRLCARPTLADLDKDLVADFENGLSYPFYPTGWRFLEF